MCRTFRIRPASRSRNPMRQLKPLHLSNLRPLENPLMAGFLAVQMHKYLYGGLFMRNSFVNRGMLLLPVMLILGASAFANTCSSFATYVCAKSTPDVARLGGGSASGQSVGFVLSGNQFSVFTTNGKAADDVIIIAA